MYKRKVYTKILATDSKLCVSKRSRFKPKAEPAAVTGMRMFVRLFTFFTLVIPVHLIFYDKTGLHRTGNHVPENVHLNQ